MEVARLRYLYLSDWTQSGRLSFCVLSTPADDAMNGLPPTTDTVDSHPSSSSSQQQQQQQHEGDDGESVKSCRWVRRSPRHHKTH